MHAKTDQDQRTPKKISWQSEPQNILLVLPTWVGDVVMATPFIEAAFARFPGARISLLMYRHLQPILHGSPWIENVYVWPPRKPGPATSKAQHKAAYRDFLHSLRAARFDLAILLPNSLRVAWLAWRIRATRRVGFNRDGRGLLLTDRLPVPNKLGRGYTPMPLVEYYDHLATYLDMPPPGDGLRLFVTEQERQSMQARLQNAGIPAHARFVVVCPGANFGASKCWSPERFAAAADQLVEQHGMHVVISPGPGEEPLASAIADAMQQNNVLLQAPCLTLGELKALIQDSALLLGNDTGPRHFARAFDTPRVTVFGPTEPRWTDTSHGREDIVRVDVPCGPCHKKVCPLTEQICMDRVTVAMVVSACARQLQQ